ncbi:class I SAM-dependent methyltransferase [Anaeromyxobacter oryzisoli]|uniref:class I SAM-dependent methyltransferase n=1 Tax=Anaeromyxobacter oryzisoli TaxID=2925408 RepID=UPI001F5A941A|nr:methyltransferase domain-containing protein [Anaeromyxobacter sp. SG63]
MSRSDESERVRRIWDRIASRYDRAIRVPERLLLEGGREWVCSRARGDVLEISVGTGRNLSLYARDVRLTGVDISAGMLEIAKKRAAELGRAADLRLGDAQALELPDSSFDTVVCTLALCSIPDPGAAVAEMRRVVRPGGRVLLLEHVRSPRVVVRAIQRALDPITVWLEGDHLVREPLELLETAGFEVEELERSKLGVVERVAARTAGA